MKRIISTGFMLLFATGLFAQIFVGGNLSFNLTSGKIESGNISVDKPTETYFSLAPKAGYFLSDKLAVGASLRYTLQNEKTPGNPDVIDRTTTIGITPFARYYAFTLNKFSLFAQGDLGFSYGVAKHKEGSVTTTGPKTTTIGLTAYPGISYKLSNRIDLEAVIGGFNFGINRTSEKQNDDVDITNDVGFGVNLDGIATTGFITIGAIIRI